MATVTLKKLLGCLTMVLLPCLTFAGVVNGGGGRAIVCRDANHAIISAELLDLYEAENVFGLDIRTSPDSLETIVDSMRGKVEELLKRSSQRMINPSGIPGTPEFGATLAKLKIRPHIQMPLVADSFDDVAPVGCNPEQLAIYQFDNLILVNGEIWNKLNTINQAALVFHESIYRDLRMQGATDSRDARRIVGYLFSTTTLEPVMNGAPTSPSMDCSSADGQTQFVAYRKTGSTGNTSLIVQFLQIENVPMIAKSTAVLSMSPNAPVPEFGDSLYSIFSSGKIPDGQPNAAATSAFVDSVMSDGRVAAFRWEKTAGPVGFAGWTRAYFALEHEGEYETDWLNGKTGNMKEVTCGIFSTQ